MPLTLGIIRYVCFCLQFSKCCFCFSVFTMHFHSLATFTLGQSLVRTTKYSQNNEKTEADKQKSRNHFCERARNVQCTRKMFLIKNMKTHEMFRLYVRPSAHLDSNVNYKLNGSSRQKPNSNPCTYHDDDDDDDDVKNE